MTVRIHRDPAVQAALRRQRKLERQRRKELRALVRAMKTKRKGK